MGNKLRLLAAAVFAFYYSAAFSLGMGELELKSHLNQRFDAEIVLTKVDGLEVDEILPNLASQKDFDRIGVERSYQLTDLRFSVRIREDGEHVIQVTSNRPVIEPFLNFLVEVIWPTGRILREYTVLLDPPVFGTDGIEAIDPGTSAGAGSTPRTSEPPATSPRRQIPPAPSVSSGRIEGVVTQDDEYGLTGPGDTLWTIAQKVRPDGGVSIQQTMLALQRANPEAFINNNINLLKAGHVLRIPDMGEIRAQSTSEAIAAVKMQNQEFSDYRSGGVTQMDARRTSRREEGSTAATEDGELKLLADEQSGSRSGAGDGRVDEIQNSLAVAREDLDRARRANSELNVRLDDLADQVETLNEIVKLKDDQLAALRAELMKSQNAGGAAAATTPAATTQTQQSASLLTNPLVLGGLGLVLVGGIAAALILLRKRRQSADLDSEEFHSVLMDEPEAVTSEETAGEAGIFAAAGEEEEDVTQQTSDVIGEAEIYIAYGRFPQAISFLQNAIEKEPNRTDIQLKLLEVYAQTEDATEFNLQFEQLKLLGDEEATAKGQELQAQIPGAAETAAASMDATVVSSSPVQAIADPDDDDDELSFDLDDLDSETEDDGLDLSSDDDGDELSLDEAMELGDAELDLDLDAADDSAETAAADDDLDLDLDDGLELDLEDDGLGDTGGSELDLSGDLDLSDDLDISEESDDIDATVKLDEDELDLGDLGGEDELDLGDDDALDLGSLEDDDDALDLGDLDSGGDDDALDLSALAEDDDDDDALDLSALAEDDDDDDDDDALALDDLADDDELELDLGDDDEIELDLGDDDEIELDLGDDDEIELDLGDDDELELGELDDDDLGELNLDEDASSKLDLARAYIEMGDNDGARSLLEEVIKEGDDGLVGEANELLGQLD